MEVRNMIRAKVTTKGQLTIPKSLRDKLGIKTGDYIVVKETSAGYLIEKEVDEKRFDKYIGYLNLNTTSDDIIRELRDQ
jgi:AbrB family looped-hinge helix DNA binding protein